ncbi:MAG: cytochrome b [Gammaproteobacteria bacterium]|nr:cytochrome b [Gammaproteobacteria bacterium]MCP4979254.1 cytochrome b [Gammaproteobacteria bacterium]
MSTNSLTVKAWDPLVRVFHWSLVFFFLLAMISEDDWLNLHLQAGYAVSFLIGFRLFWGLVGTRNARFMNFVKSPKVVLSHLGGMLRFRAAHYLGHNPVAAVMVILLLSSIAMTSFSGMVIIATEGQGPLADTLFSSWRGEWMEEFHEFIANFTLLLVLAHVAGVVFSSFLEGENLAKAMLTGRKKLRSHWQDFKPASGGDHEK